MSRSNRRHVELFDLDAIGGEGVVDATITHPRGHAKSAGQTDTRERRNRLRGLVKHLHIHTGINSF